MVSPSTRTYPRLFVVSPQSMSLQLLRVHCALVRGDVALAQGMLHTIHPSDVPAAMAELHTRLANAARAAQQGSAPGMGQEEGQERREGRSLSSGSCG